MDFVKNRIPHFWIFDGGPLALVCGEEPERAPDGRLRMRRFVAFQGHPEASAVEAAESWLHKMMRDHRIQAPKYAVTISEGPLEQVIEMCKCEQDPFVLTLCPSQQIGSADQFDLKNRLN